MLRKITAFSIVFVFVAVWMMYPAAAAVNQDLRGRIIILDAGHGLDNTNIYEGYDEQVAMFALSQKIKPLLEARGATVLLIRPTEDDVPLPARAAIINRWALQAVREARQIELSELSEEDAYRAYRLQNDILEINRLLRIVQSIIDDPETNAPVYMNTPFDYSYTRRIHPDWERIFEFESDPAIRDRFLVISLHSNATGRPINTAQNGVESYYASNDVENNMYYYSNYSYEPYSAFFADLILDRIDEIGITKRKAAGYYFLMTREHNLPGALVENGFHTNAQDRAKLSDDAFLDRLASVYADAVLYYFVVLPDLVMSLRDPFEDVFG